MSMASLAMLARNASGANMVSDACTGLGESFGGTEERNLARDSPLAVHKLVAAAAGRRWRVHSCE